MPIRSWKEKDLPQINTLLNALSCSVGYNYHGSLQSLREHFSRMKKYPNLYCTFVYTKEDDAVVGLISVIYYESVLHRKGTALVNELVVDPAFRRKGIGAKLLNFCISRSEHQGYDEIEVGVETTNLDAIRFYKRNGIDQEYVLLGKEFETDQPN